MILFGLVQRLFALFSVAALILGGWLIWSWYETEQTVRALDPTLDPTNIELYWGIALLAFAVFGRLPILLLVAKGGGSGHRFERAPGTMIDGADGSKLRVESYGPADAPALVLTHGWGLDSTEWVEAKQDLATRYRVVVWDLPGLGKSSRPAGSHYDMDSLASDLRTVVVSAAARGPVLLVGHSIGGMIVQTLCRDYPEMLGREVAGIVLENTTHTNPVKTMALGGLFRPLQKPLIEPMMKLDMMLSPLLWLMNWQSYFSGSTHLAFRLVGFGTRPTRAQLDHSARMTTKHSPAVQAKGNLAMMHWSVTPDLPTIDIPALVFTGGRDLVTLPQAGRTIIDDLPQAQGVQIPPAGHLGPIECAADYNRAIAAFADRVLFSAAVPDDRPAAAAAPVGVKNEPREINRADGAGRPI